MMEREPEDPSLQPRKRIAVACGRCRKRKIRCSGDPGNGGPCSNCKNAGYEPCLFLRVSSLETQMKDGGSYAYDMDNSRVYQSRGTTSPLSSISQYPGDIPAGDVLPYRQSVYPYSSKSYYSVPTWTSTYPEDSVDYGLNYTSYPSLNTDPVHMVQNYRCGSGNKSVYVDSDASSYSYGGLAHRPASSSDLPNFSLSSMAASLPNPSDRVSNATRTVSSSSAYRSDGLPNHYSSSKASPSHTTSSQISDVAYGGLTSSFESPVSYTSTTTIPSNGSKADTGAYHAGTSTSVEAIYGSEHQSYRSPHDSDSYIYGDKLDNGRRDSHSSTGANGGSLVSNGQVYVSEAHHHPLSSSQGYVVSSAGSASHSRTADGSSAAVGGAGRSSSSVTSQTPGDGRRRPAGNLRGT